MQMANQEEIMNGNADNLMTGNPISILNDDVMLHIFSYLSFKELLQVAQVCVRWSEIVAHKFVYKNKLTFKYTDDFPMNAAVNIIKVCGQQLEKLTMTGFGTKVDDALIEGFIAPSCPNLIKINLLNSAIGGNGARALANYCKHLQEIKLRDCRKLTDEGLENLMRSAPSLKKVDVSVSSKLNGKCFTPLGKQLEKLTLTYGFICSAELPALSLSPFENLKELCLIGDVPLSKASFIIFCQSSVNVKKLKISSSNLASNVFYEISNMTWLEELELSNNCLLDDNAIVHISRGCRSLRLLDISDSGYKVSDSSVSLIAENCRQLVKLNISGISQVGTRWLRKFAQVGILKRLIVCSCNICSGDVIDLVTRCPQLELMDISGCSRVDKSILEYCINAVHSRDENQPLKLIVGGTRIRESDVSTKDPLLIIDFHTNIRVVLWHPYFRHDFYPSGDVLELYCQNRDFDI